MSVLQVVLRGQGKNFCAGVDFEVVGSMLSIVQQGCPGRAREVLRRRLLAMQVFPGRASTLLASRCILLSSLP